MQYTLHDLTEHISRVIALNFVDPLWVTAETAQVSTSRGHTYIDLIGRDGEQIVAQVQGILWYSNRRQLARRLGEGSLQALLQQGRELRLQVTVDYHERYGLKLTVVDLDPEFTIGQLALARERTIATLREAELLDRNARHLLPPVLQRTAVISSETAAGLQDFKAQLAHNGHGYRYEQVLYEAPMQGEAAPKAIVKQLRKIAKLPGRYDAVAIMRGGGAKLDLVAFDDLALNKQIATMPLPVLVGIGHETDETVIDLTAHTALKTPTALADFLIRHNEAYEAELLYAGGRLQQLARSYQQYTRQQLDHATAQLRWQVSLHLREAEYSLERITDKLRTTTERRTTLATRQLDDAAQRLALLRPEQMHRRGFVRVEKAGEVVTNVAQVTSDDEVTLYLEGGAVEGRIK